MEVVRIALIHKYRSLTWFKPIELKAKKKVSLPWNTLDEYIHSYPRDKRIQIEHQNARKQRFREEMNGNERKSA
jgi:hypothetical protein